MACVMQFLHHNNAGEALLCVSGEEFTHLAKVRRCKTGDVVKVRNLHDEYLHTYKIMQIQKRDMLLSLLNSEKVPHIRASLHLLWAIIEPKIIEKTLPMLNELNVGGISFFYAEYSQRQFMPSLERMRRICIQSSQQCGRGDLMSLELYRGFDEVCARYAPFYAFDFEGEDICEWNVLESLHNTNNKTQYMPPLRIMVGPEGGFSPKERVQFAQIITLRDRLILRSESACVFLASMAKIWQSINTRGSK
ncbi:16S rRNA (uracil(1498)-N(3))-methyltransferase [uncultured Helicobacter sp.]|uniref:16S rRNA (uracil(1498)-N(3))-methyltransferase n=4 Tax=uncultured Helicobacter sp. TaxID=175537 RepID=UPI0026316E94|nr:16S rRNA (uracil(1498)-N(3))-methyltransferase [uncultured Helicobacter sp.]